MAQDPAAKHTALSHIKQFPELSLPLSARLPCVREMAKAYVEHVLDAYSRRRYHGESRLKRGTPGSGWLEPNLHPISRRRGALISTSGT